MATSEGATTSTTLVRALRRRDLAGILLNAMIGAGMLAAPAKVYAIAGSWRFVVLAVSAVILIPLILCFADLGSRFSSTGGPYLYAREALSPLLAFAVGWLLWFSQALSAATLKDVPLGYCKGDRPWLGSYARQQCGGGARPAQPSRLLVRAASNAYFAQTLSVISIPDADERVRTAVAEVWEDFLQYAESLEDVVRDRRRQKVSAALGARIA